MRWLRSTSKVFQESISQLLHRQTPFGRHRNCSSQPVVNKAFIAFCWQLVAYFILRPQPSL